MQEKGIPIVDSVSEITPVQRVVLEHAISYWQDKATENTNTPNDLNI